MYYTERVRLSSSTACTVQSVGLSSSTVCTIQRGSDYQVPLHVLYRVLDYQVSLHVLYTAAVTIAAGVPVWVTVILHLEYGQQVAEDAHQENQTQNQ